MNSKFALTKRKKLVLATVVICAVLISGLAILMQGGPVTHAAIVQPFPGMVGWWQLNEGSGTVAIDSSGNGNNGTIYGATYVAGQYGYALSFNGVNNYVTVPASPSLTSFTNGITVNVWLKITTFSGEAISMWGSGASGFGLYSNGNWYFGNGASWFSVSAGILSDGAWHAYSVVWNSTGQTLTSYRDGAQIAQLTSVSGLVLNSPFNNILCLGDDNRYTPPASPFSGTMDQLQIYNSPLSLAQIQAYYQQIPGFSTNLLVNVPQGMTDFIATLSWQGTGSINVTIQTPSGIYTEINATDVYQKTTYSVSGGMSTMLNIKRVEVSIGALASAQNWYIVLVTSNVQNYQISAETQT